MSVLVTIRVSGDTDTFRGALADRADELKQVGVRAQDAGAIHHRFGVGEGFVLAVDEWQTIEQFQQFFADPGLQEFIGTIGGAATPDVTVTEAVSSPDEF